MQFNYSKEKAKFIAKWRLEEDLLRSHNATEELIEEMYLFSLNQFNSYRKYYKHKEDFLDENEFGEEVAFDNLHFIETIENQKLINALRFLTKEELQLIEMHYKDQMSLLQISAKLSEKYDTIQKRLYRIKNKIKKHF